MRFLPLFVALSLTTISSLPALAQDRGAPQILVNGQVLKLEHASFLQRNILYMPLEALEHLGFRVALDPIKQQARVMNKRRFFVLEANSPVIAWQRKGLRMAHAPLWQDGTLFVPREFLAHLGLFLAQNVQNQDIQIRTDLNTLQEVQHFPTDVYSRLVFQFSRQPQYSVSENSEAITLDLKGIDTEALDGLTSNYSDAVLGRLQVQKTGTYTARIQIQKKYPTPHKVYLLKDPHRLTVDLVKIFQEDKQQVIAPGVTYTQSYQGKSFGPITYHVLRISPQADYDLQMALSHTAQGFTKSPTSVLARQKGALAAVNAGYFSHDGMPLGLLIKDAEMISSPIYARTALTRDYRGQLRIQESGASLSCFMPEQRQALAFNSVNLPRQNEQRVLYTHYFGSHTRTQPDSNALELQVALDGTVTAIGSHNSAIPEEGFVISAQGAGAKWFQDNAYVGMKIDVFSKVWQDLGGVTEVVAGGPRLLGDGLVRVTAKQERFQADIARGRAPRTALGFTPEGDKILLVVDGRQKLSQGLTLYELAELMREQGAVEAMNFDGGGSSTFVLRDQVKNKPSDGRERPVSTALVVIPK